MIPSHTTRHALAALLGANLLAGCASDPQAPSATVTGAASTSDTTTSSSTTGGGGATSSTTSTSDSTVSTTTGGASSTVSTATTTTTTASVTSGSGGSTTTGDDTTSTTATSTDGGGAGGATSTASTTSVGGQTGVEEGFAPYDPANPPELLDLSGNLSVHDPVVMEQDGTFYLFATGGGSGLNTKTSQDLRSWQAGQTILSPNPSWISGMVSGVRNLWAPDISFFADTYHLYYSASTFGDNTSCIGHATKPSLSQGNWEDHGMVVCSNVDTSGDNWNAIDPNVVIDEAGTPWLAFGSFWGGLKMIELDATGARANEDLHSIAARPSNGGALEAPFIVRRGRFYYLFMSWDRCCQGTSSTYNIRVARSESVLGPYADADGTDTMEGGGTLVLEGDNQYHGPGHNAVLFTDTDAYLIYHAYPSNGGVLRISEMYWDDAGWPVVAGP